MCNLPTGKQVFKGVEFDVLAPEENDRRAALGISVMDGYKNEEIIEIDKKAETLYLLHAAGGSVAGWKKESLHSGLKGPQDLVGEIQIVFSDDSVETQYIQTNKHIEPYFLPAPDKVQGEMRRSGPYRIAWQGPNQIYDNVGMFVYGWSNPYPEKQIEKIKFPAAKRNCKWFIAGITLSNKELNFPQSKLSYGIPDMWGASALTYSLMEGLAGIIDDKKAFEKAALKPRWASTDADKVTACAKYPASNGYVRYSYQYDKDKNKIDMLISGNAETMEMELLLPENNMVEKLKLNNDCINNFSHKAIENSNYLKIKLNGIKVHNLEINLRNEL